MKYHPLQNGDLWWKHINISIKYQNISMIQINISMTNQNISITHINISMKHQKNSLFKSIFLWHIEWDILMIHINIIKDEIKIFQLNVTRGMEMIYDLKKEIFDENTKIFQWNIKILKYVHKIQVNISTKYQKYFNEISVK